MVGYSRPFPKQYEEISATLTHPSNCIISYNRHHTEGTIAHPPHCTSSSSYNGITLTVVSHLCSLFSSILQPVKLCLDHIAIL